MAMPGEFRWAVHMMKGEAELRADIVLWYEKLHSWKEVAEKFGVSVVTMRDWRRRLGIEEVAR